MPLKRGWLAGLVIAGVILFFVLLTVAYFWTTYNKLVTRNEAIKNAWAQVDNQLERRSDLIPNLVETVKGYARHERELFEKIADARARLAGARSPGEKMTVSNELSGYLGRLLVVVENYPNLKANESFNNLMFELSGTENRIAVERKRYNDTVLGYNQSLRRFPTNFVASMFRFSQAPYFQVEEEKKEVPKVTFGS
jgi:LemA protein